MQRETFSEVMIRFMQDFQIWNQEED